MLEEELLQVQDGREWSCSIANGRHVSGTAKLSGAIILPEAWELIRRACVDSVTGVRANTRFDLGAGVLQRC